MDSQAEQSKNAELAQAVQQLKIENAKTNQEKLDLQRENNKLRLALSRQRSNIVALGEMRTQINEILGQSLQGIVQVSSQIVECIRINKDMKALSEDTEVLTPGNPRRSPGAAQVRRVAPLRVDGQVIQPVVSLRRTNLNMNARIANPNNHQRPYPIPLLQGVQIPLIRIDQEAPDPGVEDDDQADDDGGDNMVTEGTANPNNHQRPYPIQLLQGVQIPLIRIDQEAPDPGVGHDEGDQDGGDSMVMEEDNSQELNDTQNISEAGALDETIGQLSVVIEESIISGEERSSRVMQLTPGANGSIVDPIEGPSWLLDVAGFENRPSDRNREADSTTECPWPPNTIPIVGDVDNNVDAAQERAQSPIISAHISQRRVARSDPEHSSGSSVKSEINSDLPKPPTSDPDAVINMVLDASPTRQANSPTIDANMPIRESNFPKREGNSLSREANTTRENNTPTSKVAPTRVTHTPSGTETKNGRIGVCEFGPSRTLSTPIRDIGTPVIYSPTLRRKRTFTHNESRLSVRLSRLSLDDLQRYTPNAIKGSTSRPGTPKDDEFRTPEDPVLQTKRPRKASRRPKIVILPSPSPSPGREVTRQRLNSFCSSTTSSMQRSESLSPLMAFELLKTSFDASRIDPLIKEHISSDGPDPEPRSSGETCQQQNGPNEPCELPNGPNMISELPNGPNEPRVQLIGPNEPRQQPRGSNEPHQEPSASNGTPSGSNDQNLSDLSNDSGEIRFSRRSRSQPLRYRNGLRCPSLHCDTNCPDAVTRDSQNAEGQDESKSNDVPQKSVKGRAKGKGKKTDNVSEGDGTRRRYGDSEGSQGDTTRDRSEDDQLSQEADTAEGSRRRRRPVVYKEVPLNRKMRR